MTRRKKKMMQHKFKNEPFVNGSAGDVVFSLDDTEMPMTVSNIEVDYVDCVWFDRDSVLQRKAFKIENISY